MSSSGGDRIRAIANQIQSWVAQGNYEARGDQDIDRVMADVFRNPDAFIDPQLSASANWDIIKDRLSLITQTELDALLADVPDRERDRVEQEVRDQVDEFGLQVVADALADNPVPDALRRRVDDVLEEFPPDVYDAVIREELGLIAELLGDDLRVMDAARLEELREQAERGEAPGDTREAFLRRLSQGFGQQFDSIDDAIRRLQERIEAARGERLRIAPIEARKSGDDVLVRIGDGEQFDEWRDVVARRARRLIAFPPGEPRTWQQIGEVRLRGGEFEAISFERGIEEFGRLEEADEVPVVEEVETEQEPLPDTGRSEADVLADRAIDLLRGR